MISKDLQCFLKNESTVSPPPPPGKIKAWFNGRKKENNNKDVATS